MARLARTTSHKCHSASGVPWNPNELTGMASLAKAVRRDVRVGVVRLSPLVETMRGDAQPLAGCLELRAKPVSRVGLPELSL